MQTTAFAASLPLPGHTSHHKNTVLSHRRIRPACVAKPPSPKPGSGPTSNSTKRTKRKRKTKGRREGSRATESLTAAQISEKISQAVGIHLILEDVARLTNFFRSFTRSKASVHANQDLQSEVEPDSNSTTQLAVIDDSPTYEPRSVTARKIANSYVKSRGAVDRTLQAVSIRVQTYAKAAAQVTGDAVCSILAAGHETFPGLRLDVAKDAVANVVKDGWTPLSVFQWQLSPGSSEEIEARRNERTQNISDFLRGAGVSGFLTTAGSALTGVGRTVEKLAPIALQGMTKATFGYVDRKQSRKPHKRTLGSAVPTPLQSKHITQSKRDTSEDGISKHRTFTSSSKRMEILQKAPEITQAILRTQQKTPTRDEKAHTVTPRSHSGTRNVQKEPTVDAKCDVATTSTRGDGEEGTSEAPSKNGVGLARGGAIIVAAGAVAAATMTVSIPTAITCSTLIVTTMALSGAKAANATENQAYGRPKVRQSRSVQNLQGAFTKLSTASFEQVKIPDASNNAAEQNIRVQKGVLSKRVTNAFEAVNQVARSSDVSSVNNGTIETSAYAVSAPQPSILSTPIIGILLSFLDSVAFHMERLGGTLLRRSSLKHSSRGEWELLRSFQRNLEAD